MESSELKPSLWRRRRTHLDYGRLEEKVLKLLHFVLSLEFCAFDAVEKLISVTWFLWESDSFNLKDILVFCGCMQ